ncbi:nucleotide exchange factor GrpE [Umezawaea beigongshangensis]|uniref:nucleotide exchange factor GrpE n=1 Tax=Umezawaea beigongshangensis TaxID=2780383 RepID=UPI0018F14FED|nr:nucleotide exchange factor GrpE [Umezawaea beigongshangensis]
MVANDRPTDPETGPVQEDEQEVSATPENDGGGRHAAAEHAEAADTGVVVDVPDEGAELKAQLDERTADLQRLTAEYANYRKRVERDRELVVVNAKAQVVTELLGVLDDLERAAAHGDLTGAFKAVADKLGSALSQSGLEAFGHEGEDFDPSIHEAVQHSTSPDVDGPTVTAVLRRGYRFGERVLRPALVGVTDHEEPAPAAATGTAETAEPGTSGQQQD